MSGLLLRSHVTAGQNGLRDEGSKQPGDLMKAIDSNGLSLVVDRSITPSAARLASYGLISARSHRCCSPCRLNFRRLVRSAVGHEPLELLAGILGGFNRSSQHPGRSDATGHRACHDARSP